MVDDMIDGLEEFEDMLIDTAVNLQFDDWDMDKNGEISECDINKTIDEWELDEEAAARTLDLFDQIDENEDGFVDYWEFYDAYRAEVE